nr:uncharacterized protein LOC109164437 [Ipomoea batatas]
MSHGRGSAANVFRFSLAEEGPPPPSTVKSLRAATPSCCSPCDGRCRYPNQLRRSAEEEDRRPWPMFVVAAVGIAAEELLATHGCSWLAGFVRWSLLHRPSASPFGEEATSEAPVDLKIPEHATFDGMGDPREHLVSYQDQMQVLGVEEPLMCKAFLPTLKGLAQKWFLALPSQSIRCFNDLADRFLTHYAINIKPQRNLTHLSGISQAEGEALTTYLTRWQKEVLTIEGLDEQVAITFFMESLRADHLLRICQNERVLLPSIEPKTIPEDVCVTKELDPEEHPEVFWMEEIRKYKEKGDLPDNPAEAAKIQRRSFARRAGGFLWNLTRSNSVMYRYSLSGSRPRPKSIED